MLPSDRHNLMPSSLLDRLMDDDPKSPTESHPATRYDLSAYKQAVARDLEMLLNARCTILLDEYLEEYPQAKDSLLSYGITDLSSLSLLNPNDRLFLRDNIRRTIERHEPRLSKVRVNLDLAKELSRTLRFRVDALLRVHPNKPSVSFDALLQLSSNTYQVKS